MLCLSLIYCSAFGSYVKLSPPTRVKPPIYDLPSTVYSYVRSGENVRWAFCEVERYTALLKSFPLVVGQDAVVTPATSRVMPATAIIRPKPQRTKYRKLWRGLGKRLIFLGYATSLSGLRA